MNIDDIPLPLLSANIKAEVPDDDSEIGQLVERVQKILDGRNGSVALSVVLSVLAIVIAALEEQQGTRLDWDALQRHFGERLELVRSRPEGNA